MKANRVLMVLVWLIFASGCATEKDHLVVFETRHGNMYAILFDETPKHKQNFIQLAKEGRYDSTEFHRVIKDFMIQGGDVFGKENLPETEWYTIPAEFNEKLFHEKGNIAAARQGDNINPQKRSSGSQFYIVQGKVYEEEELTTDRQKLQQTFMKYLEPQSNKPLREEYIKLYEEKEFEAMNALMLSKKEEMERFFNINLGKKIGEKQIRSYTTVGGTPHLDEGYTVFGKIIQGIDVLDKIAEEETGNADKPINPVYMKVSVQELTKKKITNDYGFEYSN